MNLVILKSEFQSEFQKMKSKLYSKEKDIAETD